MVVSLWATPLILATVSPDEFGLWVGTVSLMSLITIADFGLGSGIINAINSPRFGLVSEKWTSHRIISSTITILSFLSAILLVITLIIGCNDDLTKMLFQMTDDKHVEIAQRLVIIIGACLSINLLASIITRIRLAQEKFHLNAIWEFFAAIASALGIMLVYYNHWGITWFCLSLAAPPVLANLGHLIFWSKTSTHGYGFNGLFSWDLESHRQIIKISLQFFILQVAGIILSSLDAIIALRYLGSLAASEIGVAYKLYGLPPLIASLALTPLWPIYGRLVSVGDIPSLRKLFFRSTLIMAFVSMGSFVFLQIASEEIFALWLGNTNHLPSPGIRLAYNLVSSITILTGCCAMVLNGLGKIYIQIVSAIIVIVIAIPCKIWLSSLWGSEGIIYGSVATLAFGIAIPYGAYLFVVLRRN